MNKKFKKVVLATVLVAAISSLEVFSQPVSAATNLISNPSLETTTAAGNAPLNWQKNSWGTNNATFTYPVAGQEGSKAAQIQIGSYTNGDAKWYFTDVPVSPGIQYDFQNYYQSSVSTDLVARFTSTTGSLSYQALATVPASSTWQTASATFTPPAGTTSVTVFHLLAQVGSLTVDNFNLSENTATPPPPTTNNLISNPSLETANGSVPVGWQSNKWGTNTTIFTYPVAGQDGTNAAKIATTAHTNGDAKWYFNDVSVTPGKQYIFQNYYQSTVTTSVVIRYTSTLGTLSYETLATVPTSSTWQQTTFTFTAPSNAVSLTVMHILAQVGTLTVDNFSLTENTVVPPPPPGNLIPNNSMETGNTAGTAPIAWQSNKWGTNTTTFTYPVAGADGAKAARVNMTARTSGDAKWYFDAVSVQADKDYTYSHSYKSSVPTRIVVMSLDSAGNPTYSEIAPVVAVSPSWKLVTFSIHTLPTTMKMSVLHVLEAVGSLEIDNASLAVASAGAGLIPNPSVEDVSAGDPTLPASWTKQSWGTNTPVFEYTNTGHDGQRGVKVTVSNYLSGDAKWVYDDKPIEAGKDYKFSVWYRTNTTAHVVAKMTKSDGSIQYHGLPNPEPNGTGWNMYQHEFSIPTNIVTASIFLYLSGNGWIETDNYQIVPYTYTSFARPLVTLTFDDGAQVNNTTVLPVFTQYGFKSTQCYATQHIEGFPAEVALVKQFADAGHEICSHTVSHPALSTLTPAQVDYELSHSKSYLQSITGQPITNFASPFGDYSAAVNTQIKGYYGSHRTVNEGYNSKDNLDKYHLQVQNMLHTTTLAEFQSWVTKAKADKTWLILVYHKVDTQNVGQFDTLKADFDQQMAWLATSGVTVARLDQALSEVQAQ